MVQHNLILRKVIDDGIQQTFEITLVTLYVRHHPHHYKSESTRGLNWL